MIGRIKEDVYNKNDSVVDEAAKIMGMSKQYIADNTHKLIGPYPNTYTFTKSMAEKYVYQNKGNLNLVLNRPSIVIGAYKEPIPGWVDSMAAGGGLCVLYGTGLLNYLLVDLNRIMDIIPVDILTNGIIVSSAYAGQ